VGGAIRRICKSCRSRVALCFLCHEPVKVCRQGSMLGALSSVSVSLLFELLSFAFLLTLIAVL
jgi:hypothetical protein